jgi:flagellar basal body-associated protein FliL
MEPQDSKSPEKPSKGYGKRPMWQWVVIYLVVAIVVYGLIYFLFIHKSSGTGGIY